jgi:hypothetical protein
MAGQTLTKTTFIDGGKLVCGAFLTAAPWVFDFESGAAARWNAYLSGCAIVAANLALFAREAECRQEISLGLGLWVLLSPSIVGFSQDGAATLVHLLVGFAVTASAAVTLVLGVVRPVKSFDLIAGRAKDWVGRPQAGAVNDSSLQDKGGRHEERLEEGSTR